ncbi:MAG TPA: hypothetical protein VMY39_03975 [Planctomycetota bacterium]|nr:hypothetical protein [Planctomycetota bacterium]
MSEVPPKGPSEMQLLMLTIERLGRRITWLVILLIFSLVIIAAALMIGWPGGLIPLVILVVILAFGILCYFYSTIVSSQPDERSQGQQDEPGTEGEAMWKLGLKPYPEDRPDAASGEERRP